MKILVLEFDILYKEYVNVAADEQVSVKFRQRFLQSTTEKVSGIVVEYPNNSINCTIISNGKIVGKYSRTTLTINYQDVMYKICSLPELYNLQIGQTYYSKVVPQVADYEHRYNMILRCISDTTLSMAIFKELIYKDIVKGVADTFLSSENAKDVLANLYSKNSKDCAYLSEGQSSLLRNTNSALFLCTRMNENIKTSFNSSLFLDKKIYAASGVNMIGGSFEIEETTRNDNDNKPILVGFATETTDDKTEYFPYYGKKIKPAKIPKEIQTYIFDQQHSFNVDTLTSDTLNLVIKNTYQTGNTRTYTSKTGHTLIITYRSSDKSNTFSAGFGTIFDDKGVFIVSWYINDIASFDSGNPISGSIRGYEFGHFSNLSLQSASLKLPFLGGVAVTIYGFD